MLNNITTLGHKTMLHLHKRDAVLVIQFTVCKPDAYHSFIWVNLAIVSADFPSVFNHYTG